METPLMLSALENAAWLVLLWSGHRATLDICSTLVRQGHRAVFEFFQTDKIHLRTYQKNKTVNKRYRRFFDAVYQNVAFTKFPGNKNTLGHSWPIIETGRCRIPEALAP